MVSVSGIRCFGVSQRDQTLFWCQSVGLDVVLVSVSGIRRLGGNRIQIGGRWTLREGRVASFSLIFKLQIKCLTLFRAQREKCGQEKNWPFNKMKSMSGKLYTKSVTILCLLAQQPLNTALTSFIQLVLCLEHLKN